MSVTQFEGLGTGITNSSYGGADRDPDDPSMDEEQFASAVKAAVDDASMYIDGFIAPQREQATLFYRGEPFGNEEPGRSQFVMTEVRDTVLAMMPSLLRIFTSSDEAVSFEPRTAEKVQMAEQATDYVNYLFYVDNDGFQILYNAIKDALIRKTGVIKWRWDDDVEIYDVDFTDLSDAQVQMLSVEPDCEIIDKRSRVDEQAMQQQAMQQQQIAQQQAFAVQQGAPAPGQAPGQPPGLPAPQAPPQPILLHDVKVRRRAKKGRVKIECMPVEEFICSRTARDLDTAMLVGHRSLKTMSDLVAMGYDAEEIEESMGLGDTFVLNYEAQARNPAIQGFLQTPDINDESSTKVVYVEAYVRIDRDGDGIAELHKVCLVGGKVLHDSIVRDVPFAVLCPDPEPHMIIGSSVADQTMDIQLLKSNVVRNTLDSLAQSIHPRTAVVEGQVNLDDVLNVETGAIIRMKQPGMVQTLAEPFVGQAAMPIIEWLDTVKAMRTGIIPATAGLDPDVLQSTTKTAVDAAVMGAQERTEMTARLFAENGIKRMMKGVLKLVCQHQDKSRMLRLRGKWVDVDPRTWDADMDVIVHVALGRGTDQSRMAGLTAILNKQELAMQLGGTTNPLAGLDRYRNTLSKICELLGFKDTEQFFAPIDMQQIGQMQQQDKQAKPDPNMMIAEAEQAKAKSTIDSHQKTDLLKQQQQVFEQQLAAQKMQFEVWKAQLEDARQRDKMRLEAVIASQQAEAQLGIQVAAQEQDTASERERLMAELAKSQDESERAADQAAIELQADLAKHAATLATQQQIAKEKPAPKGDK